MWLEFRRRSARGKARQCVAVARPQRGSAHWPIDVGLGIVFLRDEPVHCSCAFRFLRIVNRSYSYSCFPLEVLKDGFRKDFVMADVDDYALCLVRGMEPPPGGDRDASEHEKN